MLVGVGVVEGDVEGECNEEDAEWESDSGHVMEEGIFDNEINAVTVHDLISDCELWLDCEVLSIEVAVFDRDNVWIVRVNIDENETVALRLEGGWESVVVPVIERLPPVLERNDKDTVLVAEGVALREGVIVGLRVSELEADDDVECDNPHEELLETDGLERVAEVSNEAL